MIERRPGFVAAAPHGWHLGSICRIRDPFYVTDTTPPSESPHPGLHSISGRDLVDPGGSVRGG